MTIMCIEMLSFHGKDPKNSGTKQSRPEHSTYYVTYCSLVQHKENAMPY